VRQDRRLQPDPRGPLQQGLRLPRVSLAPTQRLRLGETTQCSQQINLIQFILEKILGQNEENSLIDGSADPAGSTGCTGSAGSPELLVDYRVKRQTFLSKLQLQYCAILSQQGLYLFLLPPKHLDTRKQRKSRRRRY